MRVNFIKKYLLTWEITWQQGVKIQDYSLNRRTAKDSGLEVNDSFLNNIQCKLCFANKFLKNILKKRALRKLIIIPMINNFNNYYFNNKLFQKSLYGKNTLQKYFLHSKFNLTSIG